MVKNSTLYVAVLDEAKITRNLIIKTISEKFKNIEYEEFSNGEDFIKFIRKYGCDFHCVITNTILPKINGYDVLKYMKQQKLLLTKTEMLIVTEPISDVEVKTLLKLGVKDIMFKPFNRKVFHEKFKKVIADTLLKDKIENIEPEKMIIFQAKLEQFKDEYTEEHPEIDKMIINNLIETFKEFSTQDYDFVAGFLTTEQE